MLQFWREVLEELKVATKEIAATGPNVSLRVFTLHSGTIPNEASVPAPYCCPCRLYQE